MFAYCYYTIKHDPIEIETGNVFLAKYQPSESVIKTWFESV